MEQNRTEIASLGEFGLIRHLTKNIKLKNGSTITGVGDDSSVLNYQGSEVLISTDLLLEGIHFDLTYFPLKHLGYKAAVAGFSDIYAMNGQPKQLTVSLGLSKRFSVEDLEDFYEGLQLACEIYGVDIVGGDTSSSMTGLCISITCIGSVDKEKITYRKGAKNTDLICVSGDLGAAYMGLQLLEREKLVFKGEIFKGETDFNPDFAGREYLLERQLKPEARKDIVEILNKEGILPTSMIDISDGLASDMLQICYESQVGCMLHEDRLPIDYQTAVMAEQFNMNVSTVALNGGDDCELLFTVPLELHEKVENLDGIHVIGYICDESMGANLIARDGTEIKLQAQGWV